MNSSLLFKLFLRLFLRHHNFLSFVSNLFYQNNNNNNKNAQKNVDYGVIKCPSCSHPPSLPGWRSQPVSAFGNWHSGRFSSRSIWLAGRLPRQWCWQLPLSLASAGAEDTLLDSVPLSSSVPWGPGTARAHPEPALCPQSCKPQQSPANPAKPSSWFGRALVALCQCLCVLFWSSKPEWFGTSLEPM